jgi:hypothetical protein
VQKNDRPTRRRAGGAGGEGQPVGVDLQALNIHCEIRR